MGQFLVVLGKVVNTLYHSQNFLFGVGGTERGKLDAAQEEAVNLVGIVLSCFFYDFLYFFGNFSIGDVEVVLVQRLLILVNVLNVCHIVWVINDCPKVTVCCC